MNTTDARLTARLFSACPPDNAQKAKLEDVLSKKYGKAVDLVWQEDRSVAGGFRIQLGTEIIDWTAEGRLEQLKEKLNLPNMKVIATGGLARVIDPKGEIFDVLDPVLTLKGLRILYEKNK